MAVYSCLQIDQTVPGGKYGQGGWIEDVETRRVGDPV